MKFMTVFFIVFLIFPVITFGQSEVIELWENGVPNAIVDDTYKEEAQQDSLGNTINVSQVVYPTLTVFMPKSNETNGTAILICPGGGYHHLAIDKEGFKVAQWLNTLGVTAFVLKYRMPSEKIMESKNIGPLQDAQRAMRIIRSNVMKWDLKEDQIGIMGFSAGGHLAATASNKYDEKVYEPLNGTSAKPNFSILLYPVISMRDNITHNGSKENLLGEMPSDSLVDSFSNELLVGEHTPPTFLVHATDDTAVPVENSLEYYKALKLAKIPTEMHTYQSGGHGFGLGRNGTNENWPKACKNWLIANGSNIER